jgi:hypothetical protein
MMLEKDANEKPIGIPEVCEAFWRIEKQEKLLEWQVMGVYLWPLIRSKLFYHLTNNSGIYAWRSYKALELPDWVENHQGTRGHLALWRGVTGWRWHLRGIIPKRLKDPRLDQWLSATTAIAPFSNRDAMGIDRYSKPVLDELGEKALVFGVGSWDRTKSSPHLDNLGQLFRDRWGFLSSILVRLGVSKEDYKKYRRVIEFLENSLQTTAGKYRPFPRWIIRNFLCEQRGFRKLFSRLKIEQIFIVNASRMFFMAAAQSCGLKVIELQCGVFSKYNMQFSWPGRPAVPYLPNEIWTWGDYWTEGIESSGSQKIVVAGATEEFEAARQGPAGHKPKTIVAMSQPLNGADFYKDMISLSGLLPNYRVTFKPHPKDDLSCFIGDMPKNMRMASPDDRSIDLIKDSEICIGVFSTALIEAASLGTKVAILKLAGWEHLAPFIDGNYANAYETVDELARDVVNLKPSENPYHFYGERVAVTDLLAKN